MKQLVSVPLLIVIWVLVNGFVGCQRPAVVNIGAVFTFDSVFGRAAKPALLAAVSDINGDPRILNGTELRLIMKDASCNIFLGAVRAFEIAEEEVVAIIGPQSSGIAHMISEIANGLQLPLVSYAATDPTLSALQFPYFVRTTHSDSYQMAAMADLVDFYEWKKVIGVFVDDDYGRNAMVALENELNMKIAKISYKLPLHIHLDEREVTDALNKSRLLGPRVYVVHVYPDPHMRILTIAQKLGMLTTNYVWLVTDWFAETIHSLPPAKRTSLGFLQGVVGLRQHIPDSRKKRDFMSRWKVMQRRGSASSGLNSYGLQAYDTVWAVAHAIESFIEESNSTITFSRSGEQPGKVQVFDGGAHLLQKLLLTDFRGLTGRIRINEDRSIVNGGYDIINVKNSSIHTVAFWSNHSGFSLVPPEHRKHKNNSYSRIDQNLSMGTTWPGGATDRPRGWVVAIDEKPLRIGVPNRASFVEFATEIHDSHKIKGYCLDVFLEALKLVPYDVPYRFEPFGDGRSNPEYDDLVKMVAENVFDAAVGDIAIVTNRTRMVDFSQPYAATGLVIVAPIGNTKSSAWVFLEPFSVEMWSVTAASFVMIAIVIWMLEHRVNDDFRGPVRRQIITMFMFSFSTLFKTNKETTVSPLGRLVMVVWLFLLMVITASYTASLTSILTIQQLSSPITGIESLITSNLPIGYQVGSFAYDYLTENLHIPPSRLVSLGSPEEYERALRQGPSAGGVAAIVDELPYIELFVSEQNDFGIIGQAFTKGGWGFAFQRDSQLAIDMSTAILRLSETGKLQKIHERWFCMKGCPGERVRKPEPNQLHLISFWGLYLLCGSFALVALLLFILRIVRQYARYKHRQMLASSSSSSPSSVSSSTHCSQVIYNFFQFIDKKEEAIKKMFTQSENSQPQ